MEHHLVSIIDIELIWRKDEMMKRIINVEEIIMWSYKLQDGN